ncbi:MAG: glutathione S-transferase family protein [Pseudomonadota bacterium]
MLTLYSIPESLYCSKLRVLLRHKGLPWREVSPPGGTGSEEFRALVPAGTLPAIADGDFVLAESEAIAEYLEERFPEPPMMAPDIERRARIRERSRFHDTRLEPAVRLLFPLMRAPWPDPGAVGKAARLIARRLAEAEPLLLRKVMSTDHLCLGDCGYPASFAWIDALALEFDIQLAWPAGVLSYRGWLASHESVRAEQVAYTPHIEAWINARRAERSADAVPRRPEPAGGCLGTQSG